MCKTLFALVLSCASAWVSACPTDDLKAVAGVWAGIMKETSASGVKYKSVTTHRHIISCERFEVIHDYEDLASGETSNFKMSLHWDAPSARFVSDSDLIAGTFEKVLPGIYSARIDIVPAGLTCSEVINSQRLVFMERNVKCRAINNEYALAVEQNAIQTRQH